MEQPEFIYDPGFEDKKKLFEELDRAIKITKKDIYSSFLRDYIDALIKAAGKKEKKVEVVKGELVLPTEKIVQKIPKNVFLKLEKAKGMPIHPIKIREDLETRKVDKRILVKPESIQNIENENKRWLDLSVPVPDRILDEEFKISMPAKEDLIKDENVIEQNGKHYYISNVDEKKKGFLSLSKGKDIISKIDNLMKDPDVKAVYCDGVNHEIKVDYKENHKLLTDIIFKNAKELNNAITLFGKRAGKNISSKEPLLNDMMKNGVLIQASLGNEFVNGKFILKVIIANLLLLDLFFDMDKFLD